MKILYLRLLALVLLLGSGVVMALVTLPDRIESNELLLQSSRFQEIIDQPLETHDDEYASRELIQRARAHYGSGSLDQTLAIYTSLDKQNLLDEKGLEDLAYYYGENQEFNKKYLTLLRLAPDHLNEENLRELSSYFNAVDIPEVYFKSLEILHQRGFSTLEEKIALSEFYRSASMHAEATTLLEALPAADKQSLADFRFAHYLKSRQALDAEAAPLDMWLTASPGHDTRQARLWVMLHNDMPLETLQYLEHNDLESEHAVIRQAALRQIAPTDPHYRAQYLDLLIDQLEQTQYTEAQDSILYDIFDIAAPEEAYGRLVETTGIDQARLDDYRLHSLKRRRGDSHYYRQLSSDIQTHIRQGQPDARVYAKLAQLVDNRQFELSVRFYREIIDRYGFQQAALDGIGLVATRRNQSVDLDWIGRQLLASAGEQGGADPEIYNAWQSYFIASAKPPELSRWLNDRPETGQDPRLAGLYLKLVAWSPDSPSRHQSLVSAISRFRTASRHDAALYHQLFEIGCRLQQDEAVLSLARLASSESRSISSGGEGARQLSFNPLTHGLTPPEHLCLADLHFRQADYRRALDQYERALAFHQPLSSEQRIRLAEATRHADGQTRSRSRYVDAIRQLPKTKAGWDSQHQLGYLYYAANDIAQATHAYRRALALAESETQRLETATTLMEIYLSQGQNRQAIKLAEELGISTSM